jgi:AraC-like DNA-binding protein
MGSFMQHSRDQRLERSCGATAADRDWIKTAPASQGFERIEAYFSGHGFDPHRHDTYAIGFTLRGVQSFKYRGATQYSVAGQTIVLHPDELHDGHAGTEAGFCYKMAYIEPGLIHDALDGQRMPLPFVRQAVSHNRVIAAAILPALEDLDAPLEELQRDQIILNLADALAATDPSIPRRKLSARAWLAVGKAREFLDAHVQRGISAAELETVGGMARYELARQFRACLGTSPYRYLVQRRLDRARRLILGGTTLADAALMSGFADQSHLTRHFKKTYGVPPGRWLAITAPKS